MTQTSPPETPQGDDPLARLHRMSRTAGLGSGDYVAINPLAVTTFVLGLASSAAMLDKILLLIPLVTLILGVLAIRQIRKSAGTQGGIVIASLGALLGLGFAGWVGADAVSTHNRERADRATVIAAIDAFSQEAMSGDYEAAWKRFSPAFHENVTREEFDRLWNFFRTGSPTAKATSMRCNQRVEFDRYVRPPEGLAVSNLIVNYQTPEGENSSRHTIILRKTPQGEWLIDHLDDFFPPKPGRGA